MARNHRSFPRASTTTHKQWSPFSGVIAAVATTTSIVALLSNANPGTILWTRGVIFAQLDSPSDGDLAAIFWGLMIASDDLLAAGAASFPDPGVDPGEFYTFGTLMLGTQAAEGNFSTVNREQFDSKAMRKIKSQTNCVLVAQMSTLGGTPVVDMAIAGRSLAAF